MNYIFLDIDGVMNNRVDWLWKIDHGLNADRMFCREAWCRLQQVVFETNAKIVLSSSWRLAFQNTPEGIEIIGKKDGYAVRLMHYFEEYGIPVVGRTTGKYDHRGKQIIEYVKTHFTPEDKWVVLDDEVCDIRGYVADDQIIDTDFETGLLQEHCEKIIQYFKGE